MARVELLLVAWDGVSPETVSQLMGEGTLPSLREMLGGSRILRLQSTIPPITAPAWASFHLGVNPGKHGILDFVRRRAGERPHLVSSRDLPYPTFWEILAEEVPVGFLAFPLGYPARPLRRGFWVPGFLAPANAASHPKEASGLARKAGYSPNPPAWFPGRRWVEDLKGSIRAKTEAALALTRRFQPVVLGIHYQETDTVQHFLWGKPEVDEVFSAADAALATLLEELSPRTVVLLSDHGMGPVRWDFHLNTWLLREGLLVLRRGLSTRARKGLFDLGLSPRRFQGLGERAASLFGRIFQRSSLDLVWHWSDLGAKLSLSFRDVDWEKTPVYSPGGLGTLSRNGRSRIDLDELCERLFGLRTPEGEAVVERIFPREELYWGERVRDMPDLVFLTKGMEVLPVTSSLFLSHRPFCPPSVPGHHRLEGFLAALPHQGFREGMPIWGIAPVILSSFGISPPDYMDV